MSIVERFKNMETEKNASNSSILSIPLFDEAFM